MRNQHSARDKKSKREGKPAGSFAVHLKTLACAAILGTSGISAFGQAFTAGDLVVSTTIYNGTSSTVAFPGTLPNGTASTADGSYPNVFNNETPDPSFGVTSNIYLAQFTTSGASVGSLFNVTAAVQSQLGTNLTTSFPSKSELALNLTPDGTGLTFMGYAAAANSLDISNSNTPGLSLTTRTQ